MIPLIQTEVCTNKKWLEEKGLSDIVAISESTPGPIAINAATFVGYHTNGFIGACAATIGVVLPSLLIISIISFILDELYYHGNYTYPDSVPENRCRICHYWLWIVWLDMVIAEEKGSGP